MLLFYRIFIVLPGQFIKKNILSIIILAIKLKMKTFEVEQ